MKFICQDKAVLMLRGIEIEGNQAEFVEGLKNYPYEFTLSLDSEACLLPGAIEEIGSKAWHLAEVGKMGLPVLPGLVVKAGVGRRHRGLSIVEFNHDKNLVSEILNQIVLLGVNSWSFLDGALGLGSYWDDNDPQLVSARSGSKYSMPGMMGTVVNVGINDERLPILKQKLGRQSALECYLNFGYTFLETMFDINVGEIRRAYEGSLINAGLVASRERELEYLKWWYRERTKDPSRGFEGLDLSMSKEEALLWSIWAVFHSWEARRARVGRRELGIPDEAWTAVTVMPMVYGNWGEDSGSGVLYTYDPQTGREGMKCSYAPGKQGIEVVGGVLDPREIGSIPESIREQLFQYGQQLTERFGCGQDIEFTVQRGELVLLQTRNQRLSHVPQLTMVADLFRKGRIRDDDIPPLVTQSLLDGLGTRVKPESMGKAIILGEGDGVGGGAVWGHFALSYEKIQSLKREGKPAILVIEQIDPHESLEVDGIVSVRGDSTSHAGNIVNAKGIPGVIGCRDLVINRQKMEVCFGNRRLVEGDVLVVDGLGGKVYGGLSLEDLETVLMPGDLNFIADKREKKVGGKSRFTDVAVAMGIAEDVSKKTEEVRALVEAAQTKWGSLKAQSQELINGVFPSGWIIPYEIYKPEEVERIGDRLREGWGKGWDGSIRSAYGQPILGKNPWLSLPVGGGEEMWQRFVAGDESVGKYGGLCQWREKGGLTEVMVGWLPAGTLDEGVAKEHFVWTLRNSAQGGIMTRVVPETPQLRAFETVNNGQRFEGRAVVPTGVRDRVANMKWMFPNSFFEGDKVEAANRTPQWEGVWVGLMRAFFEKLQEFPGDVFNGDEEHDRRAVLEFFLTYAQGGYLTREEEELLIEPKILAISRSLEEIVFGKWWKQVVIGMAAMENVLGPLTLEGQGRIDPKDNILGWLKIYGIKGYEERVMINDRR